MVNFLTDFMGNWLNKTYAYLKETRGAVRPPVTTGMNVLPTGPYSVVPEDIPIDFYTRPSKQIPFNPDNTGLAPLIPNEIIAVEEIAKENPGPDVISQGFATLYGGMMKACIADQTHRFVNPNAAQACANFAESGDFSLMIFSPQQKGYLGIIPAEEKDKPDDVQAAEDDLSLTNQITKGVRDIIAGINTFLPGPGKGDEIPNVGGAEGGSESEGEGKGGIFQNIDKGADFIKGLVPTTPGMPEIPWNLIFIGGGIVLILILIRR